MPTPRTGETFAQVRGAQVSDEGNQVIAPKTGENVTRYYFDGSAYTLEIASIVGAKRAYLKG